MHIDSYQFGTIVIDGTAYDSDCLIIGDCAQARWRRKQGHVLAAEDLQSVIAAGPSILVVGCGAHAMMKVSEEARRALGQHDIELIALDTHKAVEQSNRLATNNQTVTAALHVTC